MFSSVALKGTSYPRHCDIEPLGPTPRQAVRNEVRIANEQAIVGYLRRRFFASDDHGQGKDINK
jgi:hypothetical protein